MNKTAAEIVNNLLNNTTGVSPADGVGSIIDAVTGHIGRPKIITPSGRKLALENNDPETLDSYKTSTELGEVMANQDGAMPYSEMARNTGEHLLRNFGTKDFNGIGGLAAQVGGNYILRQRGFQPRIANDVIIRRLLVAKRAGATAQEISNLRKKITQSMTNYFGYDTQGKILPQATSHGYIARQS